MHRLILSPKTFSQLSELEIFFGRFMGSTMTDREQTDRKPNYAD